MLNKRPYHYADVRSKGVVFFVVINMIPVSRLLSRFGTVDKEEKYELRPNGFDFICCMLL